MIIKNKIWLIVSKDRRLIAKGTPRNRHLIELNDKKDKKRFLTYTSKKMAENAFNNCGFYRGIDSSLLEAVEGEITIKLKDIYERLYR